MGARVVGLAGQLTPYSFQIGWETLTIVRVGEGSSILVPYFDISADDQKTQLLLVRCHWVHPELYLPRE